WLVWRLEWEKPTTKHLLGRWSKIPFNARTGRHASSQDPHPWCSFEEAWRCYQNSLTSKKPWSGIGFALGDGWVGVDIDGCRDPETGTMQPWALDILARIRGYRDISPGGTGVHVVCRGTVPEGRREWDDPGHEHTGVALYPN